MIRADRQMGFLLQYENVAWYEDGVVRILDRRIFPVEVRYVYCHDYKEVCQAIKDMVTQSAGPYCAASMGMVLASREVEGRPSEEVRAYLTQAAYDLSHSRPTTSKGMERITGTSLAIALDLLEKGAGGSEVTEALLEYAVTRMNNNYLKYEKTAGYLFEKIPDNGTILTQCFAETVLGTLFRKINQTGKQVKVICAETRPFFQGARLTASLANEMGLDVTVISDNMIGITMQRKKIDLFTSAADVITMDGHVVNKVGTFQIALMADHFGIPYYVTGEPDISHGGIDSVIIEERDPQEVLSSMGRKIVEEGVRGYYPAFDITPPDLVTGVVTDRGIYLPEECYHYHD